MLEDLSHECLESASDTLPKRPLRKLKVNALEALLHNKSRCLNLTWRLRSLGVPYPQHVGCCARDTDWKKEPAIMFCAQRLVWPPPPFKRTNTERCYQCTLCCKGNLGEGINDYHLLLYRIITRPKSFLWLLLCLAGGVTSRKSDKMTFS